MLQSQFSVSCFSLSQRLLLLPSVFSFFLRFKFVFLFSSLPFHPLLCFFFLLLFFSFPLLFYLSLFSFSFSYFFGVKFSPFLFLSYLLYFFFCFLSLFLFFHLCILLFSFFCFIVFPFTFLLSLFILPFSLFIFSLYLMYRPFHSFPFVHTFSFSFGNYVHLFFSLLIFLPISFFSCNSFCFVLQTIKLTVQPIFITY